MDPVTGRPLILVADDDPDIRDVLELLLEDEGYSTAAAADGVQALDQIRDKDVDLILLDLAMPRLDGPSFCRSYREAGGEAPVVLITASRPDEVDRAVEACGAAGYVAKPFEIDIVLATVRRLVPSSEVED